MRQVTPTPAWLDNVLVFAILFAIGTAYMKWPRIWRVLRFLGSSGWPECPAVVQTQTTHSYSGRGGTTYRVELGYYYHLEDDYHSGYFLSDLFTEAEADAFSRLHPIGTNLQVRVHPRKPDISVLRL
jgi:hypothetical protein